MRGRSFEGAMLGARHSRHSRHSSSSLSVVAVAFGIALLVMEAERTRCFGELVQKDVSRTLHPLSWRCRSWTASQQFPGAVGMPLPSMLVTGPGVTAREAPKRLRATTRTAASKDSFKKVYANLNKAAEVGNIKLAKELYGKAVKLCESSQLRFLENTMLKAFANAGRYPEAKAWFEKMLAEGILPNQKGSGKLLEAAVKFGSPRQAEKVFQEVCAASPAERKNVVLWNMLLDAYAKHGRWKDAERIWQKMKSARVQLRIVDYNALMSAYAKANRHKHVARIMEEMKISKLMPNELTYGVVMDSLGRTGQSNAAVKFLAEMKQVRVKPNVIMYTSALNALAKEAKRKPHNRHQALQLHEEMQRQGVQAERGSHGAVVGAFAAAGDVHGAKEQLRRMEVVSLAPTVVQCTPVLKALAEKGRNEEAELWLKEMQSKQINPDVMAYTAVIGGHAKAGDTQKAVRLLKEMTRHEVQASIVTHNSIIRAHVNAMNISGALDWLAAMPDMRTKPDSISFSSIVRKIPRGRSGGVNGLEVAEDLLRKMASSRVRPERGAAGAFSKLLGEKRYEKLAAQLGIKVDVDDVHRRTLNKGYISRRREQSLEKVRSRRGAKRSS